MEYFDVVDKSDRIIGRASRDECHTNPKLIHRTVQFTLINKLNKKVLLTKRSPKLLYDPGRICFMGEHVTAGESYTEAVTRGVEEELGFTPTIFNEIAHTIFRYASQTEFVRFFLVEWSSEKINYDNEEITEIFWIDYDSFFEHHLDYSNMTLHWIKAVDWNSINN